MKTLIINGSPRKNGDTMFFVNKLKNELNGDVKIIDTYYTNIKPCSDCRNCLTHDKCSIQDDMLNIIDYIDNADNIFIASPIYFSELTGSLLQFASRLQFLWISKNIRKVDLLKDKKRNGFVILVGGGDGKAEKAFSTAKCLLRFMKSEFVDSVISHNTNEIPSWEDENAVAGINQIIERLK